MKMIWVYGAQAVHAILNANNRNIKRIITTKKDFCNDNDIVEVLSKVDFERAIGYKNDPFGHQGVAVLCSPPEVYHISDAIGQVVILDDLTDHGNIGNIIRTCAVFGIGSIVLHNVDVSSSVLHKVACGAIEYVRIICVSNIGMAIRNLKDIGYWIVGIDEHGESDITLFDFSPKTALVIGSEGTGLRHLTKKLCDTSLYIKSSTQYSCLNASNAGAVAIHCMTKKFI